MKTWSQDCLGRMKAVLFLDTNILSYLVDNTYPSLTHMLSDFRDTCILDLISSEFCQLEFVGIRKREHYLRAVIQKANEDGIIVNCSSLLKNYNQFECREVLFTNILPNIQNAVKDDLKKITRDYGIDFCCKFHNNLFQPVSDVCLHSKISKEDSLVIISATTPSPSMNNPVCFVLTHDRDMKKWYEEAKNELSQIYKNYSISEPTIVHSNEAFGINLDKTEGYEFSIIKEEFMKLFIEKNKKYYLGRTIQPEGENAPNNMFALHSCSHNQIHRNKYITIIGKDLDFCITTPNPIIFFHRNHEVEDGHVFEDRSNDIITGLFLQNDSSKEMLFSEEEYIEILSQIQSEGNYVFYHYDTFK